MKYIEDFRNAEHASALAKRIAKEVISDRYYQFMEFCGGHTHAIHRYGLPKLLPANVELIHGPGCPVCVLPIARLDKAIALAQLPNTILATYADMMRVPGSNRKSLMQERARGADVRMIYSVDDALTLAKDNPSKQIIFFAIGFETTTPPTAIAIVKAKALNLSNFSVFCNHVLTPPAMAGLLAGGDVKLDGFIGPAHVSIVTGAKAYQPVAKENCKPIVIAGFEPIDILHSILMLIEKVNQNQSDVSIQYTRAVTHDGNLSAQHLMQEIFQIRDHFEWRGLGSIPRSALAIAPAYHAFDAENRFPLEDTKSKEHPTCQCGDVLRGKSKPHQCPLFAKICTPENPLGSCMVSSEGACAAIYAYGRET
jgi:hydrogenase expression/formation protein HypD